MVQQHRGGGIVFPPDHEQQPIIPLQVPFDAPVGSTTYGSYQQGPPGPIDNSNELQLQAIQVEPSVPAGHPFTRSVYSDCSTSSASSVTRRRKRQLLTNSSYNRNGSGNKNGRGRGTKGVSRKSSKNYNIRKKSSLDKRYISNSSSWLWGWTSSLSPYFNPALQHLSTSSSTAMNATSLSNGSITNNDDDDIELDGADADNDGDDNDMYDDDPTDGDVAVAGGRRDDNHVSNIYIASSQSLRSRRMFPNRMGDGSRGYYRPHHNQNDRNTSYRYPFFGLCGIIVFYVIIVVIVVTVQTNRQPQNWQESPRPSFLQYIFPFYASSCGDDVPMLLSKGIKDNEIYAEYSRESVLLQALSNDEDQDSEFVVTGRKNGVVASDQGVCSEMGMKILRDHNGTAVDAAITTALCIGVVNPSSSGIGGGAFMLIHTDENSNANGGHGNPYVNKIPPFHDARDENDTGGGDGKNKIRTKDNNKITTVIDCREVAPSNAYVEMYLNTTSERASVYGGLAVPVPGELRGLELAHALYGTLPWKTVVAPVVDLAANGIPVSKYLAHVIQVRANDIKSNPQSYDESWGVRKLITHDDNWDSPLVFGEKILNPKLVKTLRDIMENGADSLYTGDRAQQLATDIQNAGGIVTVDDIIQYQPTVRSPIVATNVNGFTIIGVPPPSSGGAAVIGAIRFLQGFLQPLATFADTLAVHRIVESMKHVFSIRMSLSDPLYNTDIVNDAVHDLTVGPYMDMLRNTAYKDNETCPSIAMYGGAKWSLLEHGEGKNVTVVDAHEGDRRHRRNRILLEHEKVNENDLKQRTDVNDKVSVTNNVNNDNGTDEKRSRSKRQGKRKLYRTDGNLNDNGTSHFSVVDKYGNAVSMTTSINTVFGSLVVSPSTGILLGNTMDDFANPGLLDFFGLKPSEANFIQPGKKPLSSMSPTLVFQHHAEDDSTVDTLVSEGDGYVPTTTNKNKTQDSPVVVGDLILVVGGSGGPKIITAVLQVILYHIWFGKNLLEAVIYPRVHDQLIYHGGSATILERATLDHIISNTAHDVLIEISNRTVNALVSRKHDVAWVDYPGCVQAIAIDLETKTLTGASDPRKGGFPAGY